MNNIRSHKIAVFASGSGSNAENIINYFNNVGRPGTVALVVANRPDAPVLDRARRLGVSSVVVSRDELAAPRFMIGLMERHEIDVVVLAGFLLMIPRFLIERYRGKMVNIHPSLLPAYGGKGMYGRRVHEAVVAAGETRTGITVHLVDEEYDRGEILYQAAVALDGNDTPESVEAKVRELERIHFPKVIYETFFR